jgi:uncharacterized protein YcfJ
MKHPPTKHQTLTVAIVCLLAGGAATAAYVNNRARAAAETQALSDAQFEAPAFDASLRDTDSLRGDRDDFAAKLEFADILAVDPITERRTLYATVIGTEPVRETVVAQTPREICEDVVVQDRLPERDGNVGGTVAGAVIGGLVGNQVGGGNGRKLATVAGAVGGGFAGREIDKRHVGGKLVNRTERQCRTVSDTSTRHRTVAWNVTYREPDGRIGTMRTDSKPGKRITLGTEKKVVGYDVTYRYEGQEGQLRMDEKPNSRLPVINGRIVAETAEIGASRG